MMLFGRLRAGATAGAGVGRTERHRRATDGRARRSARTALADRRRSRCAGSRIPGFDALRQIGTTLLAAVVGAGADDRLRQRRQPAARARSAAAARIRRAPRAGRHQAQAAAPAPDREPGAGHRRRDLRRRPGAVDQRAPGDVVAFAPVDVSASAGSLARLARHRVRDGDLAGDDRPLWLPAGVAGVAGRRPRDLQGRDRAAAPRRRPLGLVAQVVMSLVAPVRRRQLPARRSCACRPRIPASRSTGRLYAYVFIPTPPFTPESRPRVLRTGARAVAGPSRRAQRPRSRDACR